MAMICVGGGRECDGCMMCLDRYAKAKKYERDEYEED